MINKDQYDYGMQIGMRAGAYVLHHATCPGVQKATPGLLAGIPYRK